MGEYVYMFVRLVSLTLKLASPLQRIGIYIVTESSNPAWILVLQLSFLFGYWKYNGYHRILPLETMYNFHSSCTPQ